MRSNLCILLLVLILVMVICNPGIAQEPDADIDESLRIQLSRGMCFGTCPVYSVVLFGNGTIWWNGGMYVATTGDATGVTDPGNVTMLYDYLRENGFFGLNDTYDGWFVSDLSSATLSVRRGDEYKEVYHYHGDTSAPVILYEMEQAVDEVAGTSVWIGSAWNEIPKPGLTGENSLLY